MTETTPLSPSPTDAPSALELCEGIQELRHAADCWEGELLLRTGKTYDEFVSGMRALLAPASTAEAELHRHRAQFGGGC